MKRIDLPCSVITDLLPLYQDGLCSPESRALVEAHLQTCSACSALNQDLPLPEHPAGDIPDEAEAFRRVRKKIRQGKLLKALSVCAAVLTVCFLILNAVWIPVKYLPYRKLCGGLRHDPDSGKGTKFCAESGDYIFRVSMPGYLSFKSGFLAVDAVGNGHSLFIWPQPGRETKFGVMIFEQESPSTTHLTQIYISKDLEYLDEQNTWQGASPEELQHNKALYEAHLDELRGLMDAAKSRWPQLLE